MCAVTAAPDHIQCYSVGLLWTSDRPLAETTSQHTTVTRERDIHDPVVVRTRNPSKRAAADRPGLRPSSPLLLGNSLITLKLDPVLSMLKAVSNKHKMISTARCTGRRRSGTVVAVRCVVLQAGDTGLTRSVRELSYVLGMRCERTGNCFVLCCLHPLRCRDS
jgi:hypothetical protein